MILIIAIAPIIITTIILIDIIVEIIK